MILKQQKLLYRLIFLLLFLFFQNFLYSISFDDTIYSLNKNKKESIQIANKGIIFLDKLTNHLVFSKKTSQFLKFLRQSLEEFDFDQLYKSNYFSSTNNQYRQIIFTGKQSKNQYKIFLSEKSFSKETLLHLGDFVSEFALKKNKTSIVKEPSFSGYFKVKVNTQEYNYKKAILFIETLQKIVDEKNISFLRQSKKQKQTNLYPSIQNEGRIVLNSFVKTFPHLSKFMKEYTTLLSLLTVKRYKNNIYTKLTLKSRLKLNNIKKKYSELYEYLEDLDDLIKYRIVVVDKYWNKLMTFKYNSKKQEISFIVNTKDNMIIPEDWKGRPLFRYKFALSQLAKKIFYLSMNIKINIYGLKFDTQDIKIKSYYKNNNNKGNFYFKINNIPKIKVSGYFYHIIPTWMIDLFIPGNIDILINKFTKVLQYGNHKKGSYIKMNWSIFNHKKSFINIYGQTEFLDNRFVRIAMKILNRRVLPNEKAFLELRLLMGKLSKQLQKDIILFKDSKTLINY